MFLPVKENRQACTDSPHNSMVLNAKQGNASSLKSDDVSFERTSRDRGPAMPRQATLSVIFLIWTS